MFCYKIVSIQLPLHFRTIEPHIIESITLHFLTQRSQAACRKRAELNQSEIKSCCGLIASFIFQF